jgi:hypothetical protein
MKKRHPYAITAAVCVTIGIAYVVLAPHHQFRRRYEHLRPGMTPQQVDRTFGMEAEYECRLGPRGLRVRYYLCPGPLGGLPKLDPIEYPPGNQIASVAELPSIYESAQLAFDSQDRLAAYTQIGESLSIETIRGPYEGSQLQQLGDDFFAGL